MRIAPLRPYKISFKAILYKKVSPEYEAKKDELRKEIEIFSKDRSNSEYIGKGIFSSAYQLNRMPNVVIKESFDEDETFENEEKNLELVPETIKNTQKLVARAYDDKKMTYYLLSSKVEGDSPDPDRNPWTRAHLKTMFNTLYQMDREGFYHGDLNNGNMKLTSGGGVNFLDFQWSHKTDREDMFSENPRSILPSFMPCENAQMFEMAELPYYLNKMDNSFQAKQFLRTYLQEKSEYHRQRLGFISSLGTSGRGVEDAKAFEKAQMAVLKNPGEDILRLEAKKIQFLNSFREAYKFIDENVKNKNILSAPSAYLTTMSHIQDFRNEVVKQKNRFFLGPNFGKYLDYQEKYGNYWFGKVQNWAPDTIKYALRQTTGNLLPWEQRQIPNSKVDFGKFGVLTNVLGTIDTGYKPQYDRSLSFHEVVKGEDIRDNLKGLRGITQRINREDIAEIKRRAGELENSQVKMKHAYDANHGLDVINYSLLGILKSRELSEALRKSTSSDSEYINCAKEVSEKVLKNCRDIAENCFESVYNDIKNAGTGTLAGYEDMGH